MKTEKNKMKDGLKIIMNRTGLEKPSDDFVFTVMDRIAKEQIIVPARNIQTFRYFYFLLSIPVLALILLSPEIYNWICRFEFDFSSIRFTFLKNYFSEITVSFSIFSSPTILSIIVSSALLISVFAFTNYSRPIHEQ
jgi:hypothetical protein